MKAITFFTFILIAFLQMTDLYATTYSKVQLFSPTSFLDDEIEFTDNDSELTDIKMVLLDDEGQTICRMPFGLEGEDMIDDGLEFCTEESLQSFAVTTPLEREGQVAALPLIPIAIGVGTAVIGCVGGYMLAEEGLSFVQVTGLGALLGLNGDALS